MENKITAKTTLEKIMQNPEALEILANNGVPCVSCPMAELELDQLEIGNVCQIYGLDLKSILKDLNAMQVALKQKPITRRKK